MDNPTLEEVTTATEDAENALAMFASMAASEELPSMEFSDMFELASSASQSVEVAANAFGVRAPEGTTPDSLRDRMMELYTEQNNYALTEELRREERSDKEIALQDHRRCLSHLLDLSNSDIDRLDFDAEHGDPSPWLAVKEKFIFE